MGGVGENHKNYNIVGKGATEQTIKIRRQLELAIKHTATTPHPVHVCSVTAANSAPEASTITLTSKH